MYYRYCGLSLKAEFALPNLSVASPRPQLPPDLSIVASATPFDTTCIDWYCSVPGSESQLATKYGRTERGYIITVEQIGDYLFDAQKGTLHCFPATSLEDHRFQHALLHLAVPTFLSLGPDSLIIHGSSVEIEGAAVVFTGESCSGKTTLATRLCKHGAPLLTDDILIVRRSGERILAYPGLPYIRLWPAIGKELLSPELFSSETEKQIIPLDSFGRQCASPLPIRELYVLISAEDQDTPMVPERLSAHKAVMTLGGDVFRLDAEDREQQKAEFELLSQLASEANVWTLPSPDNSVEQERFCRLLLGE